MSLSYMCLHKTSQCTSFFSLAFFPNSFIFPSVWVSFPAYMFVHQSTRVPTPWGGGGGGGQKKALDPRELEIQTVVSSQSCRCWELKKHPLEEQPVPLAAEPSPLPRPTLFYSAPFGIAFCQWIGKEARML